MTRNYGRAGNSGAEPAWYIVLLSISNNSTAIFQIIESQTSPPNLLTEADLIALMDRHGIGTDATHAEHIEKIKNREYSAVVDGKFHPAELGIGLVEGYEEIGRCMSKPELRAEMEVDFVDICNGVKTRDQVLTTQIAKYKLVNPIHYTPVQKNVLSN